MDSILNKNFIEEEYLEMYPDVKRAIENGTLKSGYEHYIAYGKKEGRKGMKMLNVTSFEKFPGIFQDRIKIKYPSDMKEPFEEWFFDNFKKEDETERIYIPVFWTGYFVNSKFGKDEFRINLLQEYFDCLSREKKYYTILNYDDGCLIDFKDLDILIFTASGKGGNGPKTVNFSIPLLTSPHNTEKWIENIQAWSKKDILCSFIGRNETHPIRDRIFELFKENKNFHFEGFSGIDRFIEITSRSKFILCPRGYGYNSFRLYEAMECGAIPIYISDFHIAPFGIDNFYIKVYDWQVSQLPSILTKMSMKINLIDDYRLTGLEFHENYCTYPALKNQILKVLNNE